MRSIELVSFYFPLTVHVQTIVVSVFDGIIPNADIVELLFNYCILILIPDT